MVKMRETQTAGSSAATAIDAGAIAAVVPEPSTRTKKRTAAGSKDVNEAIRPDPKVLDEGTRKTALRRLKDTEVGKTVDAALLQYGTPLMPQHVGLQIVQLFGVPLPDDLRRSLQIEAEADVAKLGDFKGSFAPQTMDLLVSTSLSSPKEAPTAETLVRVIAESHEPWAARITELLDKARSVLNRKEKAKDTEEEKAREKALSVSLPTISSFGLDLSKMEAAGLLDRVVGREAEIDLVQDILGQRKLNSLVLTGPPGVGKTSIVRGLAKALPGDRVFFIEDSNALAQAVGATPTTGDPRLGRSAGGDVIDAILKEVVLAKEKGVRVILGIDEIHALAGATQFWDRIKPALADGALQIVGATNKQKELYKDDALKDRLREVSVDIPTDEEARDMLLANLDKLSAFHGVPIDAGAAIKAALEAGKHFGIENPRGAELAIDAAASMVTRQLKEDPSQLVEVRQKKESAELALRQAVGDSEEAERTRTSLRKHIHELTNEEERLETLAETERAIHDALANLGTQLAGAMEMRNGKVDGKKIAELQRAIADKRRDLDILPDRLFFPIVDAQAVYKATLKHTGIDLTKSRGDDLAKYRDIPGVLSKRVIGHDDLKKEIAIDLVNDRQDTRDDTKPIGMRILLGPTGVGKTELAETLASEFFDGNLIRINGGEFSKSHELAKLKGAPPGYVGFDIGSFFAEQVRTKKRAVVLLDELEKAHPEINDFLMQILDKGGFMDNEGRWVDCTNLYFLATSNAGALEMMNADPSQWDQICVGALYRWGMKPEQLQRWDGYHVLPWLTKEAMEKILDVKIGQLQKRFEKSKDLKIEVSDAAKEKLIELGFDKVNGGRPLNRKINTHFRGQLSLDTMEGEGGIPPRIKPGDHVVYDLIDDRLMFRKMTPDEIAAFIARRAGGGEETQAVDQKTRKKKTKKA
jgi:ATP-dependent Clp protease ATP-binding subunit ClpB